MVNAATDIQYGNEFYKAGSKLPDYLVKEFEQKDPSLLSNYIEINGRWMKITDIRIKGMVEERKLEFSRLRKFYNVPFVMPKPEVEDNSNMLKVHKKKDEPPKKEDKKVEKKEKVWNEVELSKLSFSKLRKIGYEFRPKIRERSSKLLIKRILAAQNAR